VSSLIRQLYSGKLGNKKRYDLFRNTDKLFPVNKIQRGITASPLYRGKNLDITVGSIDLGAYLHQNSIGGVLVIKNNEVLLEKYALGNCNSTRWGSWSIAKSITSTLAGVAIQDGYITSLDDCLGKYIPELKGGSYADVTVEQLLTMTSGVRWSEGYENPNSDRRKMLDLQIAQTPVSILKYMNSLPTDGGGSYFMYSTGETYMLGALVAAATKMSLSSYLSQKIWARGMQSIATWWLDSPNGLEIGGSGFAATLRDYGRFAQFVLNNGKIGKEQVTPKNWFKKAGAYHNGVPYGYMWWLSTDGTFSAVGIFGQHMYIDQKNNTAVIIWGAYKSSCGGSGGGALLNSILEAL